MKIKRLKVFLLGALCFTISQPVLRIPLLNSLQRSTKFILLYTLNPILIGILIAFSAGVFEEGFRFLFKRNFIRPVKTDILEPILFGLGHGVTEALMVLWPFIFTLPISSLSLAIVERFLAIILHIGLSVIVWNGFMLNRRLKYLSISILIHGLVHSTIVIFGSGINAIFLIESFLAILAVFMLLYIYKSRKYYFLEEEEI